MRKSLRILLVEDDAEDAMLFRRRCPPQMQVHHATAAVAAMSALRNSAFDLCFTDYFLGAQTGLGLVRAARTAGFRLPIIVMTGQDIESLGENALLAGATDFIAKDGLDAAQIARVARWAMIRRHVESRREDDVSEALVGQLLGRAPTVSPATQTPCAGPPLRRVLYLSHARRNFTPAELLLLCSGFASANAACHITGVLVHLGDRFMQVIEGEHAAVEVLLRRIESDPRHGDMAVVFDEPVSRRLFAQWNMGCLQGGARYEISPLQWTGVCEKARVLLGDSPSTRDGIGRLIQSLPGLLTPTGMARLDLQST